MFDTALRPVTRIDDTSPEDGARGITCPVALFIMNPRSHRPRVWIFRHVSQDSDPHPSIEEGFEMLAAGRTVAVGCYRIHRLK
jgi:hypothetical protein